MRAWLQIARLSRPAIAVAALYALVLGTYLGLAPSGPFAAAAHVLCSPSGEERPAPGQPAADHRDCCTLSCPWSAAFSAPPSVTIATERAASDIGWAIAGASEPPFAKRSRNRARGPPSA